MEASRPARPPGAARRPRVSRRRYAVRRVGAVVVLAVVAGGVVRAGSFVFDRVVGTDGTTEAGGVDAPAPSVSASGGSSVSETSAAPTVAEAASTTVAAPTTVVTTPAVPTAVDPATVLILGDSDAGTFGPTLKELLAETGVVRTELDYKVSSGLSRPDFFDWPAHLRDIIPATNPDIVVVTFGGNDGQGLFDGAGNVLVGQPSGEPGGDLEWREEYGRRVLDVIDYLAADGRTVVWVGIPNDDNPDVTARMRVQDEVVRAAIAMRPGVAFVDTWARFSGRDGGWAEYLIDPRDGQGKDVRADDGFHLNQVGAEILAIDIAGVVTAELRARGAAI